MSLGDGPSVWPIEANVGRKYVTWVGVMHWQSSPFGCQIVASRKYKVMKLYFNEKSVKKSGNLGREIVYDNMSSIDCIFWELRRFMEIIGHPKRRRVDIHNDEEMEAHRKWYQDICMRDLKYSVGKVNLNEWKTS